MPAVRRLTSTRRGRILVRVVFYSFVVFVAIPAAFSQVLITTLRQPVSRPPQGVEELWLASEGLRLRAWLLRGDLQCPAVILAHGVGDSLESYTEVAGVLHRRGHSVLLFDFRGHGGSQGRYVTLGGREREDVRAAIGRVQQDGLASSGLVLMGWSMGAVSVLRAAADRTDLRAVVVEAPFDTYRESTIHHAQLYYGFPRWLPLIPLTIGIAELRAGFKADDVDAVAAARRIHAPLLAIVDGADPRMPEPVVRRVFDAHAGPKRLWVAPGMDHTGASLHPDYWKTVLGFLQDNGVR
jgi:hypothetical protein